MASSIELPALPRALPGKDLSGGSRVWTATWFVGAVGTLTVYLLLGEHQPLSSYGLLIACAVFWVCAIPLGTFFVWPRRTLAFFPIASILFALYYSGPIFSGRQLFRLSKREAPLSGVEMALEFALVGAVAMMVGAYVMTRVAGRLPRVRHHIDFDRALPLLVTGSVIGMAMRFARSGTSVPRFDMFFSAVEGIGLVAHGGILLAWLRGKANFWHKTYFAVVFGCVAAIGLVTGMLANVAFPVAGFVFLYCWERRKIPWMALVIGALLLAPFQVSKHEFRAKYWTSTESIGAWTPTTLFSLFTGFVSLTIDDMESGKITADKVADANEGRTDSLSLLAIVVSETPESVPYWDGYTYSDLLWHFVPRAVIPDKPQIVAGQEFPRRYALIDYTGSDTMCNLAQMIELYANFGPAGLIIGMFVIGILYMALEHVFAASSGGAIIGAVIFEGLMNMESNFSPVWGGIPLMFLAYFAYVSLLPTEPAGLAPQLQGAE
jgi:hypothetical protein